MTQRAAFDQLLPLPASETQVAKHDWDYIYEPDAATVLEHVLTRYIESLVYQAVLENVASEHAARMVAMKAASDNATKLIGTLQPGLQQGPPGGDHPGNFRDRRRRARSVRTQQPAQVARPTRSRTRSITRV